MPLLEKLKLSSNNGPESDPEFGSEFEPQFEQDPIPGERPARRGRPPGKTTVRPGANRRPVSSTAKLAREATEDLTTAFEMAAALWGMSDECCAPVLEAQAKPIAQALVAIAARNPRMLAAMAASNVAVILAEGLALYKATAPLVKAVYHNHVSGAVDGDLEEGAEHAGRIHLSTFPAHTIPRAVPA